MPPRPSAFRSAASIPGRRTAWPDGRSCRCRSGRWLSSTSSATDTSRSCGFRWSRAVNSTRTIERDSPGVCIINESFARRLFPGESPLGKVLLRGRDANVRAEIVGIAGDVKTIGLNAPPPDETYYPMRQLAAAGHGRAREDHGPRRGVADRDSLGGRRGGSRSACLVLHDARHHPRQQRRHLSGLSRR